jgi:hypothetical protein
MSSAAAKTRQRDSLNEIARPWRATELEPALHHHPTGDCPMIVSKSQAAKILNVSKTRITQYLHDGRISGDAVIGEGRHAKIDIDLARAQLNDRLAAAQIGVNGLETQLDASSESLGEQIKAERLAQEKMKTRRMEAEEKELHGHWMLTADVVPQFNRIVTEMMITFEDAMKDMAAAVAVEMQVDRRRVLVAMRGEFLAWRHREVERRKLAAAEIPELAEVEEPCV